jgi:hypothetical protein
VAPENWTAWIIRLPAPNGHDVARREKEREDDQETEA